MEQFEKNRISWKLSHNSIDMKMTWFHFITKILEITMWNCFEFFNDIFWFCFIYHMIFGNPVVRFFGVNSHWIVILIMIPINVCICYLAWFGTHLKSTWEMKCLIWFGLWIKNVIVNLSEILDSCGKRLTSYRNRAPTNTVSAF